MLVFLIFIASIATEAKKKLNIVGLKKSRCSYLPYLVILSVQHISKILYRNQLNLIKT